jgi:methionyl-tRNA synthetase
VRLIIWFLIGMDEHGQKVAQTAAEQDVTPQALTDQFARTFQAVWAELMISNDQFIRTTAPEHKAGVRELIEKIFARRPDDFYEKTYTGLYCIGCESFKTDVDIADGRCVPPDAILRRSRNATGSSACRGTRAFSKICFTRTPVLCSLRSAGTRSSACSARLEDVSASRSRFSWGAPFPTDQRWRGPDHHVCSDALPN